MRILMSLPDRRVRGGPPSHLYLLRDTLTEVGVDVRSFIYGGRTHDEGRTRKLFGRLLDLARFPLLIARHRPDVLQLNSAFDHALLVNVRYSTTVRSISHLSSVTSTRNRSRLVLLSASTCQILGATKSCAVNGAW